MSTVTITDDLALAARIMDEAANDLNHAVSLLDDVSESLADQLHSTIGLLQDCNDRTKRTLRRLEGA